MLRAFIDDTGSDPKARIMNLAGWVASVSAWEQFSNDWQIALNVPPAIEYFKHHEAKGQTGQFEGWSAKECNKKIKFLAEVIADSKISYGAITGIKNEIIRSILAKARPPSRSARKMLRISGSYELCFYNITALILQYQVTLGGKDVVDFVFDEGNGAFGACNKLWKTFKREKLFSPALAELAGNCSEADDKKIMPLQAADLMVGQATMRLRGYETEEPLRILTDSKAIIFNPIAGREYAHVQAIRGIEAMVIYLNAIWSAYAPEKASRENK